MTGLLTNKTKDPSVRKKIIIKHPAVEKLLGKRSLWSNFDETCNTLERKPEHLLQYVSAELNTDCSLNSEQQLVMKGKVTNKQIESVLKKYISNFLLCS